MLFAIAAAALLFVLATPWAVRGSVAAALLGKSLWPQLRFDPCAFKRPDTLAAATIFLTAVLASLVFHGATSSLVLALPSLWLFSVFLITDARHFIIIPGIATAGAAIALGVNLATAAESTNVLLAAIITGGPILAAAAITHLLRGSPAIGYADAPYAAMLGAWAAPFDATILLALGLLASLAFKAVLTRCNGAETPVPFGLPLGFIALIYLSSTGGQETSPFTALIL